MKCLNTMDASGKLHNPAPVEVRPGVLVFPDAPGVALDAVKRFVRLAGQFISRQGIFHVALAGGKTPQGVYRLLASDGFREQVDWSRVHLFWSDERTVTPDHAESNFGMAQRELLSRIPIPAENVHRMEAERPDLERAAQDYEAILQRYLPTDARGFPRFHLILLGMGPDGHTASLFPDSEFSSETSRWVEAPLVKHLRGRRMTLTLPVLNAAFHILFLVTGAEKAETLRLVAEGVGRPPLPAQMVQPLEGERLFLVEAAAAQLIAPAHPARGQ